MYRETFFSTYSTEKAMQQKVGLTLLVLTILFENCNLVYTFKLEEFYKGCTDATPKVCMGTSLVSFNDRLQTCFGDKHRKTNPNCDGAVSIAKVTKNGQPAFDVHMFWVNTKKLASGNPAKYFAVGLATSAIMKDLLIFECIQKDDGSAVGFVSWASGKTTPIRSKIKSFSKLAEKKGDMTKCSFEVQENLDLDIPGVNTLNLNDQKYFVHLAWGPIENGDVILIHVDKTTSDSAVNLTVGTTLGNLNEVETAERTTYRIHGVLMTIVYMGFMPIGTIIGRFYKETWSSTRIFKKKLWFMIHVSLMYSGLIFVIIAYSIIVIISGTWWPDATHLKAWNHALVGGLSIGLFIMQTSIPFLIPNSNLSVKKIYYKIHVVLGFSCYSLGILNIGLASEWISYLQPCEGIFVTCVWAAFHLSLYTVLTTLLIINDCEDGTAKDEDFYRAVTAYPLNIRTMEDAPGAQLRIILLWSIVIVSFLVCAMMSALIFNKLSTVPCNHKFPVFK